MATIHKKTHLLKQGEIAPDKEQVELKKGAVDFAIKEVKNVQWPEPELEEMMAEIPKRNGWLAEGEIVGFNHNNIRLFKRFGTTSEDGNLYTVRIQFDHIRPG